MSFVFLMIRVPPQSKRTDTRFPYTTRVRSRHRRGDAREIGGARETIEQRDAEEQDARGERPEDEIFESRFARPVVAPHEAGEDVGREAVELEPDIERHQVARRSEEHTSELQSLMRISYAVFCLKKKNKMQS